MKKKNVKYCKNIYFILFFFLLLSYYELNSNYSFGGIIRDLLFFPTREINNKILIDSVQNEIINENNELKKITKINNSMSEFDIIYSTIVERNNAFWLEELTINKGTMDGIIQNMIVVNENGVIGIIKNCSLFSSKIRLLTGKSTNILVEVNNSFKILSSDNNKLYIKGINAKDNIKEGDMIITSGLSDIFPKGLIIGKIKSITKNKDGVGYTGEVELSADTNNLRFVAVLRRKIQ